MRIILALICFIAMFMHAFFGYYLYVRGESVFEPDNMIVAVQKKVAVNTNKLSIFQKKSDHIDDPVVKEQAKNAAFYEKPDDGLVKTEERTEQESAKTELNVSPNSSSSSSATEPTVPAVTTAAPAPVPTESKLADEPKAKEETHYLPFSTGWSGFLQVENALITVILFLLGFSICCVKGRGPASRWVFGFNLIFWSALGGSIYFFLPANTPLVIFNIKFAFPQWYLVISMCSLAALLSLLLFFNAFRKPIDAAARPVKKEPEKAPKAEPAAQAEAPKPSRFGFGAKKEEKVDPAATIIPVPPEQTHGPEKRPE